MEKTIVSSFVNILLKKLLSLSIIFNLHVIFKLITNTLV